MKVAASFLHFHLPIRGIFSPIIVNENVALDDFVLNTKVLFMHLQSFIQDCSWCIDANKLISFFCPTQRCLIPDMFMLMDQRCVRFEMNGVFYPQTATHLGHQRESLTMDHCRFLIDKESFKQLDSRLQNCLFIFACTNSVADPFVYGFFNLRFYKML